MASLEAFRAILSKFKLPHSAAVGVAVSGGCDSIALAHLTRHVFKRAIALTVDHGLRAESANDARRTAKIMEGLGMEHHVLKMSWPEGCPPLNKIQSMARTKRYQVLLGACSKHRLRYLFTAHHMDDNNETFLLRLARGSSVIGLAGISPQLNLPQQHSSEPIPIIRPLLGFKKESLIEICEKNSLPWVEDPSNSDVSFWRNSIRQTLSQDTELQTRLADLVSSCGDVRRVVAKQVSQALETAIRVHKAYGSVAVDWKLFSSLSDLAAMELMNILVMFVTASDRRMKIREWQLFKNGLKSFTKPKTLRSAIVYPEDDRKTFVVGRAPLDHSTRQVLTPIRLGETLLWDNRFLITLGHLQSNQTVADTKLFVRSMVESDWSLASKGVRKIKTNILPPLMLRNSLPLITDAEGNVALAPFLKVVDRRYGVTCSCVFKPKASLRAVAALSSIWNEN